MSEMSAHDRARLASGSLLDGVNARIAELERQVGDLTAARLRDGRSIDLLEAQVLGLLRRTRRPGEKLGRKR